MTRRTSLIALAILLIALAVRLTQVETTAYDAPFDAGAYLSLASQIAHTGTYSSHAPGAGGTKGPSAYFPPAFPYLLAVSDLLSGHTTKKGKALEPARLEQAVLGTAIVALLGLVALEAFGSPALALIAMALAAGYPVLVELSAILVAENLLTALMLAAMWAALRARRATSHRYGWIAAAGALTGLAALSHENGILLAIPLAAAVWTDRPRLALRTLTAPALLLATAGLTITPWAIRNAVQLHAFVPISDETGITLVGTYNGASAAYRPVPYKWRFFAGIPGENKGLGQTGRFTEPQLGDRLQSQALTYIGDHPLSPLVVGYHNTLRMFELEGSFAWHASATAQDIDAGNAHAGVISLYVLCILALLGIPTRLARRAPKWIWVAPILLAVSAVLVNMETPRFREPLEPLLILLAACALTTAGARAGRRLRRRLGRAPVPRDGGPAVVARGASEPVEVVERLA